MNILDVKYDELKNIFNIRTNFEYLKSNGYKFVCFYINLHYKSLIDDKYYS